MLWLLPASYPTLYTRCTSDKAMTNRLYLIFFGSFITLLITWEVVMSHSTLATWRPHQQHAVHESKPGSKASKVEADRKISDDPIPNILHYTMIQRDENVEFNISLKYFVSLYSARVMLKPDVIYIHTTFNESMIEKAKNEGNKWTQLTLNYPEVKVNYVTARSVVNGIKVERPQAKSDFVRWRELYDKGGIYLDFDVYALRDVKILRETGFNAIVGREIRGSINTGVVMTKKHSKLAALMDKYQYKVFNGGYVTHAVKLLTPLAERLVWSPREVLILDSKAWAPTGFRNTEVRELYEYHKEKVPVGQGINDMTEENAYTRWNEKNDKLREWEMDFSSTYFLHAFRRHYDEQMPYYTGFTIKKLLDRNSNLGLALYKVIQIGVKEGVFDPNDDTGA